MENEEIQAKKRGKYKRKIKIVRPSYEDSFLPTVGDGESVVFVAKGRASISLKDATAASLLPRRKRNK